MAAQPSTSSQTHSELSCTGRAPEDYLQRAKEFLRISKVMISGNHRVSLKFNHGQCAHLVKKLDIAVQSTRDCVNLSSSKDVPLAMINWKFLVQLALDVANFVQNCCKDEWIQASSISMNAFEHVAALDSHLELCIWSIRNRMKNKLGTAVRRELAKLSSDQERRLTRLQDPDLVNLLNQVKSVLNLESISNLIERQLVTALFERLKAAMASNVVDPDKPDLAKLSLLDQEVLLRKVEAALNSKLTSNSEHYQLATFLRGRLKIAVANRTRHNPNLALLSFWEVEDKRIDQERIFGTDLGKCELETTLLARLKRAATVPPPAGTDSAQLEFRRVHWKSLHSEEIPLGKGSSASVYKVKWLGVYAAEKRFPVDFVPHFNAEVSALVKLSHPNIVQLLCHAEKQGEVSMVLELMDMDLTHLIKNRLDSNETHSPFSVDESIDIILQIAEGMDYLHRERILHRDLKPENILVKCVKLDDVEFVYAKVSDFNISKRKERTVTFTHPTCNIGTTRWMAPELIKYRPGGNETISGDWYPDWYPDKCDVYSFSMVCYTILTGHIPFENDGPYAVNQKVLHDERPPLPLDCRPFCLRSMIQKCWRPEPKERPSFSEICTELRFMKGSQLIGWDL